MSWHKRLLLLGVAGTVAMAASACAGGQVRGADRSPQPSSTGETAATQTQPATATANDDTFVYAPNLDVVTDWDPATSYSNENIAMSNIYEGLTRYNSATRKPEPRLATEWTSAAEGKEWTFKLRQGVKFHTGAALDAEAAKKAIERTIKENSGAAYIWGAVDTIEAPDASTLKFTLKYATPLDVVAASGYAAYIYDTEAVDQVKDGKTDAGTGPYTIDSWQKGKETELTLKAYEDYWGGWKPEQYKKVAFRVTPEITTAWQLLKQGEVNFVQRLNPQLFEQASDTEGVQVSRDAVVPEPAGAVQHRRRRDQGRAGTAGAAARDRLRRSPRGAEGRGREGQRAGARGAGRPHGQPGGQAGPRQGAGAAGRRGLRRRQRGAQAHPDLRPGRRGPEAARHPAHLRAAEAERDAAGQADGLERPVGPGQGEGPGHLRHVLVSGLRRTRTRGSSTSSGATTSRSSTCPT